MTLTKEAYQKIVKQYPTLLVLEEEPAEAFRFVWDVLTAESDAVKKKYPYATRAIEHLESVAFCIRSIRSEIRCQFFGEEQGEGE